MKESYDKRGSQSSYSGTSCDGSESQSLYTDEVHDRAELQSPTLDDNKNKSNSQSNENFAFGISEGGATKNSVNFEKTEAGSVTGDQRLNSLQSGMAQAGSDLIESNSGIPVTVSTSINMSENDLHQQDLKADIDLPVDENLKHSDGLKDGKGLTRRKFLVNVLRCESLAALSPATLERLFHRDYDIIVSMVPLPSSSVLPGPSGPIHFGPPSYSSMTPWMKLVLYSSVGKGPLSVVLMKGQCLRLLPAPLAGCMKALIWSWDESTVGGLGGKFEGNLVNGNILLHCLNSLLKHSAVLVQPLSKCDLDESGKMITMDIPLPLKNFDGSVPNMGKEMGLSTEEILKLNSVLEDVSTKVELWTTGYIRLLRLFKETESGYFSPKDEEYEWVPLSVEFGIPLFSPKLCQRICDRIVVSQLLQTDSLACHHDAMHRLRRRLREVCAEYQAIGPTAKLLYHTEQTKEPSRQLVNYASGRWNLLTEPSTPISGTLPEHQRLRLANRNHCRTEVLSFDGSILRSYVLSPVYEAATRTVEDAPSTVLTKPESDDTESKEVVLPGVNLIFDGYKLQPFDIGACLQARQPVSLIAEASVASASLLTNRIL